jgi:other hect domain ubiquitin protein ligase E3
VDVDLLQRHTKYHGLTEDAPRIKFLWETLKELSETEKLRFVKFCWGQERLPANDEEFERNQVRFMIKAATYSTNDPDKALPKADTCFFNLELPAYSTKDALKNRLLLAINTDSDSINADQLINLDPNAQHNHDRGSDFEDIREEDDY